MLMLLAAIAVVLYLIHRFSPLIYDIVIVKMTSQWYKCVIQRLDVNARVLDIGIGTGSALACNAESVQTKNLKWVGVDYDSVYVDSCKQKHCNSKYLGNGRLTCVCASVYDDNLKQLTGNELFDAVYFSGSISLMPDPVGALHATAKLLKPNGKIYITQTFQRRGAMFLSYLKPMLRYLTTIDFGRLVFESEFDETCRQSKLKVLEKTLVPNSVDNVFQAAFLIVLDGKLSK